MSEQKLQRTLTQWAQCSPLEMSKMSSAAVEYAISDARADILTMGKLLCEIGYPSRGATEETIYDFSAKVQKLISHTDAVEIGVQQ